MVLSGKESFIVTTKRFLSLVLATTLLSVGAHVMFHFGTPAQAQPGNIASRITSIADVTLGGTAVQVAAANASRRSLSCTNNDAASAARWGDSAVTATRGQRISAGSTVSIGATGAVFMIAEVGAPVVSCTIDSL
jgi:hypothetical protein